MQIFWISLNYVLPSFFRSSSWPLTGDFQAFGTLSNELAHNTIEACASLPQVALLLHYERMCEFLIQQWNLPGTTLRGDHPIAQPSCKVSEVDPVPLEVFDAFGFAQLVQFRSAFTTTGTVFFGVGAGDEELTVCLVRQWRCVGPSTASCTVRRP
ncbi:hypothetical protein Y032_0119g860 [Ancylostoma ceylanicum]|uniref:Uncharacterized protein n=2 Tax=Ancylostoma ceylanicum TaxID=53326 RepID=A0A016TAF2_9BILA|nr:hypothetical protein Y032_0119g860 [Ancylostoma ceylanicum]